MQPCLSERTPLDEAESFLYIRRILKWSLWRMKFLRFTLEHVDDIFDVSFAFFLLTLFSYCGVLIANWSPN
jgi:hypothetical protein